MADKLRRTFPIDIKIGEGEQPANAKLSAIASQSRNGLNIIEKAIGDVWNESGDNTLAPAGSVTNAILAANLARALGQQQELSPRIPPLPGITRYVDSIVGRDATNGNTENVLRYKPVPAGASLVEGDFTVGTTDPAGALAGGQFKATADAVEAAGHWHVTPNGKLITFTPVRSVTLTYKPSLVQDIDSTAQFTVIPDPQTNGSTFNGLKLAYANAPSSGPGGDNTQGFWLYLPPRRPLVSGRKIATSPNESGNEVDPTGVEKYFFQGTGFNASSDPHYRYKFPAVIQSVLDGASPVQLPDNFMYLFDRTTGTKIDGLTFSVDTTAPHLTNGRYVVKVQGSKLNEIITADLTLVSQKDDEAATAYKNRFFLVCPGTSSTKNIAAGIKHHFGHAHTGADGTPAILHSNLIGLYENNAVSFGPSGFRGDDHPQYLHREGMNLTRDLYRNGMRGDLLMSSTTAGGSNDYFHIAADSNRIHFGNNTKSLYYNQANDAISVLGADLRLETSAKRLEFNDAGVYLDQSRMDQIWKMLSTQKSYQSLITATDISPGGSATIATINFTIPTGCSAYVTGVAALWTRSMNASTASRGDIIIQVNGGSIGSSNSTISPAAASGDERAAISNTARSALLGAGSHTITILASVSATFPYGTRFQGGALTATLDFTGS